MDYPVTEAFRELLDRKNARGAAGTDPTQGMKDRESAGKRSIPEVAATSRGGPAHMGRGGVGMASLNQWRTIRERPLLKIANGGIR